MKNNPGLLPLKLGTAQNKVNSWSFIQVIDLSNLIREFHDLQYQYVRIKNAFENETNIAQSYKKSFYNSYNLAQSLENKITIQINQLNPLFKTRSKRGLINGLGSVIKAITGNLDQEDAQKYEKAINTLTNNQNKIKTVVHDQISLLTKSIQTFQNSIQNLTKNQITLKERIDQVEQLSYKLESENIGTYYYFFVEMVISQITTEFQTIYDILEKIEIAITFSKLNILHNSLIEPKSLLNEIQLISTYIVDNKLPFEPKLENLLIFEKIIEIKSYSKENQIIFIIEIPIVEKQNYDYFHLYSLPAFQNKSFHLIVPHSKYLIMNEQNYLFFDTPCKEIIPEEFICHETNTIKTTEDSPCEIQLLKFTNNLSSCRVVSVKIEQVKIQKLELDKWIVLIPELTVAVQRCGKNSKNVPLKGSYVLELNPTCEVRIKNTLIRSFENPKRKFENIVLPKLDFAHPVYKTTTRLKALKLDNINLNELSAVKNALEINKQSIDSIENNAFDFNDIDGWTVLIYIIMILILLFVFYKFYSRKCIPKKKEIEDNQPMVVFSQSSANPEANPRILH